MDDVISRSISITSLNPSVSLSNSAVPSQTLRGSYANTPVVIKPLRVKIGKHRATFRDVIQCNERRLLTQFQSNHLVRYYGVCYQPDPHLGMSFGLVIEDMSRGSLYDILHSSATALPHRLTTMSAKMRVLQDVIDGVHFLHDHRIIHGSLSSHCIMLDYEGRAKLSNLDCSAVISPGEDTAIIDCCDDAVPWTSPEAVVNDGYVTIATDIYSFGIIALELLTETPPYVGQSVTSIKHKLSYNQKLHLPSFDSSSSTALTELIERCFSSIPDCRPSLCSIEEELGRILQDSIVEERCARAPSIHCPITCDIFVDPVMCSDGHTYEREAIMEWWENKDEKGKTSPVTNLSIKSTLVTNYALKGAISEIRKL